MSNKMIKLGYWYIGERIIRMENKSCVCINTEKLSVKNFPDIIKEHILNGLRKSEKIIIFTDSIYYNDLEEVFQNYSDYIVSNINDGNIIIELYDSNNFDFEYPLSMINKILLQKEKFNILWDIKNIVKKSCSLEKVNYYFKEVLKASLNKNIKNIIYMNNQKYDFNLFNDFCKLFDMLVVCDKGKDIIFDKCEEFEKATTLLQSYAEIKYQNKNLLLFNETMSNTPMNFHKDEFKSNIFAKLKDLCDLDFCILYTSERKKDNFIFIDSYYGTTKKHRYTILNDLDFIKYQIQYNEKIIDTGMSIFLHVEEMEDEKLKDKLNNLDVISALGVSVEYDENIKGVLWVGRYKSNGESLEGSIKYVESICKTVFYLIQEQQRFFNLQNRFVQNEKLRAMGEMAAGIAHDINNILTPVIGSVQLLKDKYRNDLSTLKQLKIIEMCAYDATNIINKVKKITKNYNHQSELEVFDINELIVDAINLTKNKWLTESILNDVKINIFTRLNSNSKAQGNSTELREVIINIITNAVDSIQNGGKIEISSLDFQDQIVVEIKDNGMGMNKEIQKRIFEPFFTTKGSRGSGLGLSVSYNIIESFGGNIEVESEEDVGTSFKIKLPICKEEANTNCEGENSDLIDFSGNILVVDDKEDIRNIVAEMLKSVAKCKVKTCDGHSLNKIEEEFKVRNYDIVISDFSMPNVNGLEVAERIKNISKNTYFCLMTGWIGELEEEKMENVDNVLNKPISKKRIEELFIQYKKDKGI